ncbi:unnamed protein product [Cyclocybe aegerita]|uniref:Uncharacterized protein n=1 Tax=Cyclocybe aegerita TaxID=1973307 RepID=A0A8S0XMX2_CYCAE|nr:unnamed protein product [Cyclocybe aegerita]
MKVQDFWPFRPRYLSLHVQRLNLGCTQSKALSILHDPEQVFQLSPLVYKIGEDGSWYTLPERLPLFGSRSTTNVYRCQYTKVEGGYNCDVHGSLGTRLNIRMHVRMEGKYIVVNERVAVKALFFLMPYIVSTMMDVDIHKMWIDSLVARIMQSEIAQWGA